MVTPDIVPANNAQRLNFSFDLINVAVELNTTLNALLNMVVLE
jgi:hypothetical protein